MAIYNEMSHTISSSFDSESMDPLYRWDTHFPERFKRINLYHDTTQSHVRQQKYNMRNRNTNRYKTQPITFDEIKEVDEEPSQQKTFSSETEKGNLKSQFTAFSQSMDGFLPEGRLTSGANTLIPPRSPDHGSGDGNHSSGSSKENLSPTGTYVPIVKVNPIDIKIPLGISKHEACCLRRKKRRQRKSIEEEPEIEQIESTMYNVRSSTINQM